MGCSEPIALQAIRDTCIRFAEQSLILNQILDATGTIPGIATYDLDAGSGQAVQLITHAWLDHDRLEVITPDSLAGRVEMFNDRFPGADTHPGRPTALIQNVDQTFTLNRTPSEKERGAITIRAAVKPLRTATSVDDLLFNDYAVDIGFGAVAYLMNIPNDSFSNPMLAGNYEARYINTQHQARIRANKALGRVNVQVKLRRL
jgi:hypothetical protein